MNLLLLTDSYKASHYRQYPPKTQYVYSYFESRGGDFPECCFFGLQYYLNKYLTGKQVQIEKLTEAHQFWERHFGDPNMFNYEGWQYIACNHDGCLPVRIKAVPKGTVVPVSNVLMTMRTPTQTAFGLRTTSKPSLSKYGTALLWQRSPGK